MERKVIMIGNGNMSEQEILLLEEGGQSRDLPLHGDELKETKKLLKLFEAHLSGTRGLANSSLEVALGCLRTFIRHTKLPPWQWRHQTVSDFIYAKKKECDLSVGRQASYFTYLRIFQNYLLSDRNLCNEIHRQFGVQPQEFIGPENSIPIKRKNRVRKRVVSALTKEEYERLIDEYMAAIALAEVAGSKSLFPLMRDVVMVQLTYLLGLRVAELCSLLMSSFCEDRQYPHFGPYSLWTVIGKGSKVRTIRALNPEIKELMDWYFEVVRVRFLSENTKNPNLIFLSERGCKLCERQFARSLGKMGAQAGITRLKVTPHILRHTNGTEMVHILGAKGAQEQMGHEHLSTTLGTYYHEDPAVVGNRIRQAVTGITAAVAKASKEGEE